RPSHLDRIPFDSIAVQDNQTLTFDVFSPPKEKRGHRRIIKSFSVKAHHSVWLKHYLRLSTTDVQVSVRSLASSLALRAGIPKENIVTMGYWSGSQVFENHYRREQMSQFDITNSLLSGFTGDIEVDDQFFDAVEYINSE
ncbi:hypothetical protein BD560DRAFT_342110, partial [Blakeslea trispora]